MVALTLAQTSPASVPDRNIVKAAFTGNYTLGTADPLPLAAIADSQVLVQVPFNPAFLPVTPYVLNCSALGYTPVVERLVTNGVTSFGIKWWDDLVSAELPTGAYPAAILAAEVFLEILCPTVQQ